MFEDLLDEEDGLFMLVLDVFECLVLLGEGELGNEPNIEEEAENIILDLSFGGPGKLQFELDLNELANDPDSHRCRVEVLEDAIEEGVD